MRQGEEKAKFCADICLAARKCRIMLSKYESSHYKWLDPVVGVVISGHAHENEQDALELACEALAGYFNQPHP